MFRVVCFGLSASFGLQLAAGTVSVVRRVNTYDGDASDIGDEDQTGGAHCVVWGDWAFEGMNFRSKEEADTYYKQMKSTELAVAQFRGSREVQRFKSKRLTRVDWSKMKQWCQKNRNASKPKTAEMHIRHDGAVTPSWEASADRGSSLFETSSAVPHRPRRSSYNPVIASLAEGEAGSSDPKVSTLTGKVAVLEGEAASLASKASDLFESIGVDGSTTTSNGTSMLELAPKAHGNGKFKSHTLAAKTHVNSKLKLRLAALEESTAAVQEKTNLLEVELFGTSTADKSVALQLASKAARSFRLQIETVAAQVDELKSRLSALQSTPLLGEAAKLEDTTARIGAEAAQIFTSIGLESIKAPTKPTSARALKVRLGSLEGYVEDLQRNAASLEHEILGNSWSRPSTSSASTRSARTCIKDHTASLGEHLQDLKSRLSALANSPIVADIGSMEQMVTSLSSRAASLSKNVGISGQSPQELRLAPEGTSINSRIASLEGYVGTMQTTTAALEQELSGNVGTVPAQSQKDTLKSKARFLELQLENMNSRLSALEQQV